MSAKTSVRRIADVAASTVKCDLYLRLSDGRKENGSFVDREKALRDRANQLGWTVHRVVIENDLIVGRNGKASDNASAFKRRTVTLPDGTRALRVIRPGFRSMLEDLRTRTVQAILAEDLDRTLRDHRDGQDLIDEMRACKGNARSLSGSLTLTDGGTDAEIMTLEMLVTVAKKASADTARRVRIGRERQANNGIWGGGLRPYGFTPVAHPSGNHRNTELIINRAEANEIRQACKRLLTGVSLRELARDLRTREIPTVTGAAWSSQTLRDILLRPINAGIVINQGADTGTRLPGKPIVPEETYRATVAKLTDPSRRTTPGPTPRWLGSGIYLCGHCGGPLYCVLAGENTPKYRCTNRGGTGHVARSVVALDAYVQQVAIAWLTRPDVIDLLQPARPDIDTPALRTEAMVQRQSLIDLIDLFMNQKISKAQLVSGTARGEARLAEINRQLDQAVVASPLIGVLGAPDVAAAWAETSLATRRAMIQKLMTVTVLPAPRRGTTFRPSDVEIRWHYPSVDDEHEGEVAA